MGSHAWLKVAGGVAALALVSWIAVAEDGPKATGGADAYCIPLHKRAFEFTYNVEIAEWPKDAKELSLWVPMAFPDENQAVEGNIGVRPDGASVTLASAETSHGPLVPSVNYHWASPDRFKGPVKLTHTYKVTRREYIRKDFRNKGAQPLSEQEKKDFARWLQADQLVPIDGRFADIAKKVAGDEKNVVNLGRKFYDHVLAEMKYDKSGTGWGRGDSNWACDSKYGNCTDFHALFMSLCRASGIPARFAIGFSIPEQRGAGEIKGYHCWAEFYVPGYGWVPVDISEADKNPALAEYYFGAHTEDRVQFTMGRDLELSPPQKGEPLNFFIYPYAEADGKEWKDGIKRSWAYKDVK